MLQKSLAARAQYIRTLILTKHQAEFATALEEYGGKKYKDLPREIRVISDTKKEFITQALINLAKYDFRVKFMEWFLSSKEMEPEKAEEISACIKQAE